MSRHPMLALIPDELLFRSGRADHDARRAAQLVRWLANRQVRATLLDIEQERSRRRAAAHTERSQPR